MRPLYLELDFCGLVLASVILVLIGRRVAESHGGVRRLSGLLAALSFLGYLCLAVADQSLASSRAAEIVLRALGLAGVVHGGGQILLVVLSWLHGMTVAACLARVRRSAERRRQEAHERRDREERAARARELEQQQAAAAVTRAEAERTAQETRRKAEGENRRRGEARARVELFYNAHASAIAKLFPRKQLKDYLTRHLGDDQDAAQVEAVATQLQAVLAQLVEKVDPSPKDLTVDSLVEWYQETRARIDAQSMDKRFKHLQLVQLHVRYVELMDELMKEMEP